MTYPLHVAFVWHQHQPFYKSPVGGKYRLPWVRLHGIKDYLDMALILDQYPKLHQTFNLVPSLLLQLDDYAQGNAFDPYLELLLKPVEALSRSQHEFIIDRFFDSHYPTQVEPHSRYRDLHGQREDRGREWCLQYWRDQDYADLLAWHNLAWFDPMFYDDPDIEGWLQQQQGFSLSDRQRIYAKQQQLIRRIVPEHARLRDAGQIEITTSPYTHPILPLLVNEQAGRVARPGLPLPRYPYRWQSDVARHLERGKAIYREHFGGEPAGLWPSEQSVSPAILPDVHTAGFKWLISDEGVLGWSLGTFFSRDDAGCVIDAEKLYQPYRLELPRGDLAMVFRDHRLSDLIGFSYSPMSASAAAGDLIGRLEAIRDRLPSDQPWLVTIALDGENCWSYYPEDGAPFLHQLYSRLSQHNGIKLVTVSEYLEQYPPTACLEPANLHSGSWIEADFTTWIGDPVKNRAWELLAQARQVMEDHPKLNDRTWEALFAAEGSDWFWWFGAGHSSLHDAYFDELFREHLRSLYQSLNESPPQVLNLPLEDHQGTGDRLPQGFIHPTIDGVAKEREWTCAGRIEVGGAMGTMHRASVIRRLWYGFDHFHLYLRLDFSTSQQRPSHVRVAWYYPDQTTLNSPLDVENLPSEAPLSYHYRHQLVVDLDQLQSTFLEAAEYLGWQAVPNKVQFAVDRCLEMAIPWQDLQIQPGQDTDFVVLTCKADQFVEAVPPQQVLAVKVP